MGVRAACGREDYMIMFRSSITSIRSYKFPIFAPLITVCVLGLVIVTGCTPDKSPEATVTPDQPTTMAPPQFTTIPPTAIPKREFTAVHVTPTAPLATPTNIAAVLPTPEVIASVASMETTLPPGTSVTSTEEAIRAVQGRFPEVAGIRPLLTPEPFQGDRVIAREREDGWQIIFVHGVGDCATGCLSTYYWYFDVWSDGVIEQAGEFSRVFEPSKGYIESGTPLWGVPR